MESEWEKGKMSERQRMREWVSGRVCVCVIEREREIVLCKFGAHNWMIKFNTKWLLECSNVMYFEKDKSGVPMFHNCYKVILF